MIDAAFGVGTLGDVRRQAGEVRKNADGSVGPLLGPVGATGWTRSSVAAARHRALRRRSR